MSLIRTDYVPEWRISAHAQSVLAAGQKHHNSTDTVIVKVEYQIVNNLDQGSISTVLRAKARL